MILLLGGTLLLSSGMWELSNAQANSGGSSSTFNSEKIKEAKCNLLQLIEGEFGGVIAVAAGIGAIIASAMGGFKAALALLVTSVGAFILRSLVSLFFDTSNCDNGNSGQGGSIQ